MWKSLKMHPKSSKLSSHWIVLSLAEGTSGMQQYAHVVSQVVKIVQCSRLSFLQVLRRHV